MLTEAAMNPRVIGYGIASLFATVLSVLLVMKMLNLGYSPLAMAFALIIGLGIALVLAGIAGSHIGYKWGVDSTRITNPQPGDRITIIGHPWDCVRILQERGMFLSYDPITRVNAAIVRGEGDEAGLYRCELVADQFVDPATVHNVKHGDNLYVDDNGKVVKGDKPALSLAPPIVGRRMAI